MRLNILVHRVPLHWGGYDNLQWGMVSSPRNHSSNKLDGVFVKTAPILAQQPVPHLLRGALPDRHDDITIPRPGVFPVKVRRLCGRVRMRVVKPHHAHALRPRCPVRLDKFAWINLKPIARLVLPRVRRRDNAGNRHRVPLGLTHEEPAALVRVIPCPMRPYGGVVFSRNY